MGATSRRPPFTLKLNLNKNTKNDITLITRAFFIVSYHENNLQKTLYLHFDI